jgi:hypothetical protein
MQDEMRVIVERGQGHSSERAEFRVLETARLSDIKEKIHLLWNIPPNDQRLYYDAELQEGTHCNDGPLLANWDRADVVQLYLRVSVPAPFRL